MTLHRQVLRTEGYLKFLHTQKEFYNQNDMNNIKIAKDITGKKFRKNSFVYNFMSSLRQKVNDPLGVRANKRKEISQR